MTTEPRQTEHGEQLYGAYRAVSLLAVASLVFGVLSILTVFSWFFAVIPLAGIVLGRLALQRIRDFPSELTGRGLAWAGLVVSLGLWIFGSTCLVFARYREVPYGYTALSFESLQADEDVPGEKIPLAILDLEDKKVYIKGYMYPGRRSMGIKQFILVPTIGHCKFCSRQLKSTEMILVTLAGDLTTRYRSHLAGFGGKLRIDAEQAARAFGGLPYRIEADYMN